VYSYHCVGISVYTLERSNHNLSSHQHICRHLALHKYHCYSNHELHGQCTQPIVFQLMSFYNHHVSTLV
jgi:hypothetical protein